MKKTNVINHEDGKIKLESNIARLKTLLQEIKEGREKPQEIEERIVRLREAVGKLISVQEGVSIRVSAIQNNIDKLLISRGEDN
jgi:hypothetical protein